MSATAQSKRLARPISRRSLTTGQRTAKEARQAHAARWRSELVREGSGARREHGLGVAVAPAGELVAVVVEHAVGRRRHDLAVAMEHAQVLGGEPAPCDARDPAVAVDELVHRLVVWRGGRLCRLGLVEEGHTRRHLEALPLEHAHVGLPVPQQHVARRAPRAGRRRLEELGELVELEVDIHPRHGQRGGAQGGEDEERLGGDQPVAEVVGQLAVVCRALLLRLRRRVLAEGVIGHVAQRAAYPDGHARGACRGRRRGAAACTRSPRAAGSRCAARAPSARRHARSEARRPPRVGARSARPEAPTVGRRSTPLPRAPEPEPAVVAAAPGSATASPVSAWSARPRPTSQDAPSPSAARALARPLVVGPGTLRAASTADRDACSRCRSLVGRSAHLRRATSESSIASRCTGPPCCGRTAPGAHRASRGVGNWRRTKR
eukprot:scaffold102963_cov71-Phaeocystis_antarctica.AAC.6